MRKFNILINSRSNARVRFLQSEAQSELIYHLYDIFKDYCGTSPTLRKKSFSLIKETGKIRYNISFAIRSLPCFNELYSLFYKK